MNNTTNHNHTAARQGESRAQVLRRRRQRRRRALALCLAALLLIGALLFILLRRSAGKRTSPASGGAGGAVTESDSAPPREEDDLPAALLNPEADAQPEEKTEPVMNADTEGTIGSRAALDIALANAGAAYDEADRIRSILDRDAELFDVSFTVGRLDYRYEIDCHSGMILSFETSRAAD